MSHSEDIDVPSVRGRVYLGYFVVQYFSVNFHFLNNDKSYKSDFFTIDTIDDGLSFDGIESAFSPNFFWLVSYTIFRKHVHVYRATWSDQRDGLI
jgi:hypothetical protein